MPSQSSQNSKTLGQFFERLYAYSLQSLVCIGKYIQFLCMFRVPTESLICIAPFRSLSFSTQCFARTHSLCTKPTLFIINTFTVTFALTNYNPLHIPGFPFMAFNPFFCRISLLSSMLLVLYCVLLLYPVVFETPPLACSPIHALYLYLQSPYSSSLSIQFQISYINPHALYHSHTVTRTEPFRSVE